MEAEQAEGTRSRISVIDHLVRLPYPKGWGILLSSFLRDGLLTFQVKVCLKSKGQGKKSVL